jgi:hypothetical protein
MTDISSASSIPGRCTVKYAAVPVEVLVASLIAVAGTLLGSVTTYFFQRQTVERAERFARQERLRQERMAVYGAFAGAVTDHRRAVANLWFRRGAGPDDPAYRAAREECDRLGAALDHARFQVQLIADDAELVALAARAHIPTNAISTAADHDELKTYENQSRDAVGSFVTAASAQILGRTDR